MHQGSPPTHPQEVTSACLSGFSLKQAEIHSPSTNDAQLLNSHTCLRAVTSLIALEIPRRGYLATSWRKEMPGARREGLCSLWKERCGNEGQHPQFTSHHGFAGEQNSLWNSLCKAQPGTGTTPRINPLSKPEVSFSLFLPVYTISAICYGKTSTALQ